MKDVANIFKTVKTVQLIGPMEFCSSFFIDTETIYVDGGLKHKKSFDSFNISIGDGDSTTEEVQIKFPPQKDESDLKLALELLEKCEDLELIKLNGFLGGRKDHELGNLFEVAMFLKTHKKTIANFENQIVIFASGDYVINTNGTFSIFALEDNKVDLSGKCKYTLENETIKPFSSHGLSNEGEGRISLHTSAPLIVYFDKGVKFNVE